MSIIKNTSYPLTADLTIGSTNTDPINDGRDFLLAVWGTDNFQFLTGKYNTLIHRFYFQNIKEDLYVTAIDNLIKKNDYLQLTIQFDQELISENEFDKELEENEDKYLIKMNRHFNTEDFNIINNIIPKLKRNFTSDEISELFSAPIEVVNSYIHSVNNKAAE